MVALTTTFAACNSHGEKKETNANVSSKDSVFTVESDRFDDIQVLRYQVPGFNELSLKQKQLAYYLYQAGLSGRDIYYDQKYKHNLQVRKTLEAILTSYSGSKDADNYKKFLVYAKKFFFANGIHHHYGYDKMIPQFDAVYLKELITKSAAGKLPLEGMKVDAFIKYMEPILYDPKVDGKDVDQSPNIDNIKASANNFYEGVSQKEVEDFYSKMTKKDVKEQPMYGLNSKVVKENGKVVEKVWKVGGMYSPAIEKVVYWLQKAMTVAENEQQKTTLDKLIKFYQTGDLTAFDDYSIAWVADTSSMIDFTNGFIEVYSDAIGKKGSYEMVLSMRDLEATKLIAKIAANAQWFEDNSPIMTEHKKKNVKGISAKVITVIAESGESAPSTPIGINLPNNEWIREEHGSKSVSLGNLVDAYNIVGAKSPLIDEFGYDQATKDRIKQYAPLAGKLHTDMHEAIGHASGQLNPGVGTTDKTLKIYASALEEARADLVGLYYIMDQKLVDIGVMPSLEVGKAEYDNYIMNGLMTQLNRIEPGKSLQEAHMRNRQLNAAWAYEKGKKDNVIEKVVKDGKTYFKINDYTKLRTLFGELLREIQRIKSEGDFEAGKGLIETYAVKVDQALLKEVHDRYKALNIAPYKGFIQPKLIPVMNGDKLTDVKIEYPTDFIGQMLDYAKDYSFLPIHN
jgi:dipeptidyl-peptidase-3